MRPRPWVQLQATAVLLVTTAVLVVLGDEAAPAAAVFLSVGTALWSWFSLRYRWLRARSPFSRSADRASKDATMVVCFILGLLVPTACAWIVTLGELRVIAPPLHGLEAALSGASLIVVPLSILVSSSVDWYLIRAFREGVYDHPACQPEIQRTSRPMDYARHWISHRMAAEFFVYVAISIAIATAAIVAGNASDETGENVLNMLGAAGVIAWTLKELGKLRDGIEFVRFPSCGLANWVTGPTESNEQISGFVLDVSLDPGVQLIEEPRGHPAQDIALKERSVPLRQCRKIKPIAAPRPICPGGQCEFWIPDCEVGLRALEAERPQD